jgi:hypothetical protein
MLRFLFHVLFHDVVAEPVNTLQEKHLFTDVGLKVLTARSCMCDHRQKFFVNSKGGITLPVRQKLLLLLEFLKSFIHNCLKGLEFDEGY